MTKALLLSVMLVINASKYVKMLRVAMHLQCKGKSKIRNVAPTSSDIFQIRFSRQENRLGRPS